MTPIQKARADLDRNTAVRLQKVEAIQRLQRHLSRDEIDDVLDAIWLLGDSAK